MSVQTPQVEKTAVKRSKVAERVEEIVGQGFDPNKFAANFDVLSEAAGGLTRLRRLVLTLAASGRITQHQSSDGDAVTLLAQLSASRGPGKAKAPRPDLNLDAGPFRLPQNWCWAYFLDVASIDSHLVDPAGFLDLPHVAPDNIEKGTGRLLEYRTVREDGVTSSNHRFFRGQILYSKIRPNLSKVVRVDFEGLCSADMYPLTSRVDRGFLQCFMLSQVFLEQVVREDNRLAMPKVNQEQLGATLVAVPPLAEQKRIVAKVDQLMALCDDLEARQTKKRETGTRLTKSALEALTTAEGPEEFDVAWQRVVENFDVLIEDSAGVFGLRSALLGLGLSGWLTRFSRRQENLDRLPSGWTRTTIGELASFVTSGSRNWKNYYAASGATFVRSQDIKTDALDLSSPAFVAVPTDAEGTRTRITRDDILITITGANVGRAAHVDRDVPEAYVSQHVALVRLKDPDLATWVQRWLISPTNGRGDLLGSSYGDKPGLNLVQVKSVVVDLPPVVERQRILRLIARMLGSCDELEGRLRRTEDRAAKLVEAVVQELVA